MSWINQLPVNEWGDLIEILVLAVAFYFIILFFKGTRGAQVLSGFILFWMVMLALTYFFELDTLNYLLGKFSVYLALAFLIIFQPEIRRALAELGKQHVFGGSDKGSGQIEPITQAVELLSERKIGALVAIQREINTRVVQETGTRMDALLTPELLASIFYPNTPLHDGGVIIEGNRILVAGCLFPLSERQELNKELGTRHRAAIGLTEETDAVVIVVSEETGNISLAYKGSIGRDYNADRLRRALTRILGGDEVKHSRWRRVQESLDLTPEGVAKTEGLTEEGGDEHGG